MTYINFNIFGPSGYKDVVHERLHHAYYGSRHLPQAYWNLGHHKALLRSICGPQEEDMWRPWSGIEQDFAPMGPNSGMS